MKRFNPIIITLQILSIVVPIIVLAYQGYWANKITKQLEVYEYYQIGDDESADLAIQKLEKKENRVGKLSVTEAFIIGFLSCTTILFLVLYLIRLNRHWRLIKRNLQNKNEIPVLTTPIDYKEDMPIDDNEKFIFEKIKVLFETEKIYLDKNLTINSLAEKIGTNKTTLSYVINHYLNRNFPTLLNDYRIKEAVKLMSEKNERDQYTIETIAEMCGYSNRQVFHSAFKRIVGVTPNVFKSLAEEV